MKPSALRRKQQPKAAAPGKCPSECLSSQPFQMLVRIARQSHLGDPEGCATVLAMLATSRLLRQRLQRVLAHLDLSEVKLTALVSLYAIDPEPATPAYLAFHSQVSRATITDALKSMRTRNWIVSEPAPADRRMLHIRLTNQGRDLVEKAVRPFLATLNNCGEVLSPAERDTVVRICTHLDAHFQLQPI